MRNSYRLNLTRRIATLPVLLRERKAVTRQALAALYDVDPKTISRDLTVLMEIYPIRKQKVGREVKYVYDSDQQPRLVKLQGNPTTNKTLPKAQKDEK